MVVLPCTQCSFLLFVSDSLVLPLSCNVMFLLLKHSYLCAAPYSALLRLFCPVFSAGNVISIHICKFHIPWFRRLLAYLHLSAVSPPNKRPYWWEVCMCVFYLRWVSNWYRLLVASLTAGLNIVPITENSPWCLMTARKGTLRLLL